MGKRIIEELATDTIQDNDFILMDNNTTPTDPDDDTAGTRKMRAKDFVQASLTVDETPTEDSENLVTSGGVYDALADVSDVVSTLEVIGEASGSIATFDDGSANPIKELTAQIVAVQSGSGDPSPENVRPISGWDGANVTDCGVNLWDEKWEQGVITSGEKAPNTSCIRSKNYISVKPNKTYYLYCGSATNQYFIRPVFYDLEKHYIENGAWCANGTFTTPDNCYYIYLTTQTASSAQYGGTYNNDISINYPSTDTSYHAYNGNTYPISWSDEAGTVYGGDFKVFKDGGKWYCTVMVDRVIYTPTTSDTLSGYVHTSNNGWAFTLNNSPSLKVGEDAISNINVPMAYTITTNDGFCKVAVSKIIFFLSDSNNNLSENSSYSDIKNAFDTFVTNYSPQAVYELATPTTTTFEIDTEIATLLGVNNIFADCGDVSVEYIRDLNIIIEELEQGGGGGGINYSTTEQNTGLKWVDGRPIYQKTYHFSSVGQGIIALDNSFTATLYDHVWQTDIHWRYDTINIDLGNHGGAGGAVFIESYNNQGLYAVNSTGVDITDLYFTIRYTKTADL